MFDNFGLYIICGFLLFSWIKFIKFFSLLVKMGLRTYLSVIASAAIVSACAHYKQDHKDFTIPLLNPLRVCLGNSTQSPEESQTLSPAELYGCAEDLYRWTIDFDCPWKNQLTAQKQLDEALENLNAIPVNLKPKEGLDLEEKIINLKRGITQENYCQ